MRKNLLALGLCAAMVAGTVAGCSSPAPTEATTAAPAATTAAGESKEETTAAEAANADLEGSLVFAIWDNNLMEYIESNDMAGKFQEKYPNAEIEVEKLKDDSEYWNSMKMRTSANQLPDVMFNKPFTLSRFQDYLLDLSDLEATKNNTLAAGYALDGKVLGVPMTMGYEYVYYWKDMFAAAGVEVPTTWDEFKTAAETLQAHFGKDDPDFMAIALGAKDEWPITHTWSSCRQHRAATVRTGMIWLKQTLLLQKEPMFGKHMQKHLTYSPPMYSEKIRSVWGKIR